MLALALLSADLVGPLVLAAALVMLVVVARRSPASPTLSAAAISASITVVVLYTALIVRALAALPEGFGAMP